MIPNDFFSVSSLYGISLGMHLFGKLVINCVGKAIGFDVCIYNHMRATIQTLSPYLSSRCRVSRSCGLISFTLQKTLWRSLHFPREGADRRLSEIMIQMHIKIAHVWREPLDTQDKKARRIRSPHTHPCEEFIYGAKCARLMLVVWLFLNRPITIYYAHNHHLHLQMGPNTKQRVTTIERPCRYIAIKLVAPEIPFEYDAICALPQTISTQSIVIFESLSSPSNLSVFFCVTYTFGCGWVGMCARQD